MLIRHSPISNPHQNPPYSESVPPLYYFQPPYSYTILTPPPSHPNGGWHPIILCTPRHLDLPSIRRHLVSAILLPPLGVTPSEPNVVCQLPFVNDLKFKQMYIEDDDVV